MAIRIGLEQIGAEIVLLGAKDFAGLVRSTEKDIERLNSSVKTLEKDSTSAFTNIAAVSTAALGAVSLAVGLIAGAVGGIGAASLTASADYEQGLANIRAITFATTDDIKALDATITDLASHTRVSMHEAALAATELARAGVTVKEQVAGALKAVVDLSIASAGELGLERSAVLVGSALKAFNLDAKDSVDVVNAITAAAQNSAITFVDLQRSFQQAAPSAALFGLTVEDLASVLGVMGQQGIRGSDAGTSLKQAFQQLVNPGKQALEIMKQYGISLFDTTGAIRPFRDFLADIETQFGDAAIEQGKLTEAQRANALATIGGSDAIRALIVVAKRGVGAFDEFQQQIADSTKSAEAMAAIMQNTLNAQVQILVNNLGILATKFGTGFLPILKDATAQVILFARSLIPLATLLSVGIAGALSGQGLPTDFGETLKNLVSSEVTAGILGFINLLSTIREVALTVVLPALGEMKNAFDNVFGTAFNAEVITQGFISIGQAVITVGAVVAGVAGIFRDFFAGITDAEAFRNVLIGIAVVPLALAALGILSIGAAIISTIGPALLLSVAIGAIVAAALNLTKVTDAFASIGESASNIPTIIDESAPAIEEALVNPFEDAALEIVGVLEAIDASIIANNISAITGDIETALVEPFDTATAEIGDILSDIDFGDFAQVGDLSAGFTTASAEITSSFDEISDSAVGSGKVLDGVFASIKDAIGTFVEESTRGLRFFGGLFIDSITSTLLLLESISGAVFGSIANAFLSLIPIVSLVDKNVNIMAIQVLQGLKGINTGLDFLIQGAQNFLRMWADVWNQVGTIVRSIAGSVIDNIGHMLAALGALPGIGAVATLGSVITGGLSEAPQQIARIGGAIGGLGANFDALGTKINGAIEGLTNRTNNIVIDLSKVGNGSDDLKARLAALQERTRTVGGAFDDLADKVGGGKGGGGKGGAGKALKEVGDAISGFLDSLTKSARLQSFVDAFGDIGAKAIDNLVDAVVSNIDKDGAKAADSLHDFVQLLRKNNVPEWELLAESLETAFANALIDKSDVAIQAAVDVLALAADAMKAQGRLTQDTFISAFGLAQVASELGSQGAALIKSITESIAKGTTDLVKEVGKTAQALASKFIDDLPIEQAREFGARLIDAVRDVIRERSPEAIKALQDLIIDLNFDAAISKLGTARSDAINKATEDAEIAQNKLIESAQKDREEFENEANIKGILAANIEFRKDYYEKLTTIAQDSFDANKQLRSRDLEDLQDSINKERETEARGIDRAQQLADAKKKAMDKLSGQGVKQLSKVGDQTIGIVGSAASDSEVDNLKKKWAIEDARRIVKEKQDAQDKALKRGQQDDERNIALMYAAQLLKIKKTGENEVQRLKDAEENRQQEKKLSNFGIAAQKEIDESNRKIGEVTAQEDSKFAHEFEKLTEQKTLADTVFAGMLAMVEATVKGVKDIGTELTNIGFIGGKVTVDISRAAANSESSPNVGISGNSGFAQGGLIPGIGPKRITAHGGEFVMSIEQVAMFERMFRPQSSTPSGTSNRVNNYNVNANYSTVQSPVDITDDLRALIALTS